MSEAVQENTRIIPDQQTSLTKEQRDSIGLLSIGTFLEYFDLMLYIHMAGLLNELFFEPTDPHTTSLMMAFAFCATFVFRPIGALIFGWLGDNIGRKFTVIITTFMMAATCLIMANLPTYAQIGAMAAWIITICRIVQGISSMGESIGAQLYLTETIKPPMQYASVEFLTISILCYLSLKIYPLLILKIILIICSIFIIFCPYLLNNVNAPYQLFLIQFVMILLYECLAPALPICYKSFPVFKRFTYVSMIFAISRTSMYVITAFAFTYLYDHFGHWSLWFIMVPIIISFAYGLFYFDKLAKECGGYPIAYKDAAIYPKETII